MGAFDEAIAVRQVGEGRYEIRPDQRFAIAGAVNGGVLLASVLRAVLDSSPHPYPIATSAHFLRAPRPEPAQVEVERLKHGKAAATARTPPFPAPALAHRWPGRISYRPSPTCRTAMASSKAPIYTGRPGRRA